MVRIKVDCSEKAVIEAAKLRSTTAARTQRAENRAAARELRNAAKEVHQHLVWSKLPNDLIDKVVKGIVDTDEDTNKKIKMLEHKVEDLRDLD